MSNHFKKVVIENFKSARNIDISCKRINLFIGEPNVGKSNILEALSLFSAPFSSVNRKYPDSLEYFFGWDQIRYKNIKNLFYFQDSKQPISVITDKGIARLHLAIPQDEQYEFIISKNENELNILQESNKDYPLRKNYEEYNKIHTDGFTPNFATPIQKDGKIDTSYIPLSYPGFVKKYSFNETLFKREKEHNKFPYFLLPSYGSNVFTIVQGNHELADIVASFFEKYQLELIFIQESSEYVIQRKQGRIAYQLPYDSISDTLQRIILHLAAIYSNKNSVLIFEEPEAHSFPAYITRIAQEIMDAQSNQFFISSHSPYLVEEIIENAPESDVAVFACQYKNHETIIRELNSEELSDLKKYKFDIIYNIASFEK